MRVRVVFEMVSNLKLYTDCDTFSNMANSSMSIDYLYQTSLHSDNLVKDDRLLSLKRDICNSTVNDGEYASLLHFIVAANILQRQITSVFPIVQNPCVDRDTHNQSIVPLCNNDRLESIHIMWTHAQLTDLVGWSPNHFVPCIPKDMFGSDPPPKVAKLDQNIEGIDTGEYTYFFTDQQKDSQESDSSASHQLDLKQTALPNDDKWQTPDIGDTPNQPRNFSFPKSLIGGRKRYFQPSWFDR